MIYPEVSSASQLGAFAVAFPVGAAVGLGIHALLGGLRRHGAIGRFFARWWAWYAGLTAALTASVAIAGPYVFAKAKNGTSPSPLTAREVLVVAGVLSLAYAALAPVVHRWREGKDRV